MRRGISNFNDVKPGDILECFKMEKTAALEMPAQDRTRQPVGAEARRCLIVREFPEFFTGAGNADRSPHTRNSHRRCAVAEG